MQFSDITKAFTKLGDFASSDTGQGLTNLAGLGLTGYGMYNQNKLQNKQNDLVSQNNMLQLQNYNYNKSLNDRLIAKENMAQDNLTSAFSDSFGGNKKKKSLGDYAGMYNFEG